MTAQLDLDRPLRLHPLTYLEEGDEVTVGRADTDSYGLFPPDGAALVRYLEAGNSPRAAAQWYREQYGEEVDVEEFLDVLEELDLLVPDGEEAAAAQTVGWQRLGRALFSPLAWLGYALLIGGAIAAVVRHPALGPSYNHLFFTRSSLTLLTLGIVLGQIPFLLLHESFHALAGRRLGLNSKLSIGRRFYYVVFVTSLDGLVAVPRRKRYLPMLAGMLLDVLVLAALTLGAAALQTTTRLWRFGLQVAVVHRLRCRASPRLAVLFLPSHRSVLPGHDRSGLQRPPDRFPPAPRESGQPADRPAGPHRGRSDVDAPRPQRGHVVLVADRRRVRVSHHHGGDGHGSGRHPHHRDRAEEARSRPLLAERPGCGGVPASQLQRIHPGRLSGRAQPSPPGRLAGCRPAAPPVPDSPATESPAPDSAIAPVAASASAS